MGRPGNPRELDFVKRTWGGDFDIHNGPQGGKFDSTAILKSGKDLGMSEWSAILENTKKSFERVSRWTKGKEYRVAFFESKNVVFYAHQCSVFKGLIT